MGVDAVEFWFTSWFQSQGLARVYGETDDLFDVVKSSSETIVLFLIRCAVVAFRLLTSNLDVSSFCIGDTLGEPFEHCPSPPLPLMPPPRADVEIRL